jgi:flagellar basal-body rod modification protein FlgD
MSTAGVQNSTSTLGSSSSSAASTAASQTASSQTQLAQNMNSFLELLTAQLQNQDPLNPMDTSQFTNQLVLFAQVQQQIDINQNLETMMSSQNDAALASATDYIGKDVAAVSSNLPLQNSDATFYYTTPSDASSVNIVISDSAGNIVDTITGNASAGTHSATWDGANINGGKESDGTYSVSVTSTGASGSSTTLDTAISGTVTGVSVDPSNNETQVLLGSVGVDLNNLIEVGTSSLGQIGTALSNAQAASNSSNSGSSSNTNTNNSTN